MPPKKYSDTKVEAIKCQLQKQLDEQLHRQLLEQDKTYKQQTEDERRCIEVEKAMHVDLPQTPTFSPEITYDMSSASQLHAASTNNNYTATVQVSGVQHMCHPSSLAQHQHLQLSSMSPSSSPPKPKSHQFPQPAIPNKGRSTTLFNNSTIWIPIIQTLFIQFQGKARIFLPKSKP